jgi:hypothetical protein
LISRPGKLSAFSAKPPALAIGMRPLIQKPTLNYTMTEALETQAARLFAGLIDR